jgi:hypothetical protein
MYVAFRLTSNNGSIFKFKKQISNLDKKIISLEQFEIENVTISQAVNKFTAYYVTKFPLLCTRNALPNCLEPDESTPHFLIRF